VWWRAARPRPRRSLDYARDDGNWARIIVDVRRVLLILLLASFARADDDPLAPQLARIDALIAEGKQKQAEAATVEAGDIARYKLRDPRRAIELYRRASALHKENFERHPPVVYLDLVADVLEFDLHDAPAAVAQLRTYGLGVKNTMPWVEAEIFWLEHNGKQFTGDLSTTEIVAFARLLFLLTARGGNNTSLFDPVLNVFNPPEIDAQELQFKLEALPPSHAMFARTYLFAVNLPLPALSAWLLRNDPGGLLALGTSDLCRDRRQAEHQVAARADEVGTADLARAPGARLCEGAQGPGSLTASPRHLERSEGAGWAAGAPALATSSAPPRSQVPRVRSG
jgi:hypothetical protein